MNALSEMTPAAGLTLNLGAGAVDSGYTPAFTEPEARVRGSTTTGAASASLRSDVGDAGMGVGGAAAGDEMCFATPAPGPVRRVNLNDTTEVAGDGGGLIGGTPVGASSGGDGVMAMETTPAPVGLNNSLLGVHVGAGGASGAGLPPTVSMFATPSPAAHAERGPPAPKRKEKQDKSEVGVKGGRKGSMTRLFSPMVSAVSSSSAAASAGTAAAGASATPAGGPAVGTAGASGPSAVGGATETPPQPKGAAGGASTRASRSASVARSGLSAVRRSSRLFSASSSSSVTSTPAAAGGAAASHEVGAAAPKKKSRSGPSGMRRSTRGSAVAAAVETASAGPGQQQPQQQRQQLPEQPFSPSGGATSMGSAGVLQRSVPGDIVHGASATAAARALMGLLETLGMGVCALSLYRSKEAVRVLRMLPAAVRSCAWVLSLVARAHFEMVEYSLAASFYERARRIAPYYLEGAEIYSTVLWHLHNEVRA